MMIERKPQRLKTYDYSLPGYYFITICTHQRKNLFGNIINGSMQLNGAGKIVNKHLEILNSFKKEITVAKSVIMPNHIHLIVINDGLENESIDRTKMTISKLIQQFKAGATKEIRGSRRKK